MTALTLNVYQVPLSSTLITDISNVNFRQISEKINFNHIHIINNLYYFTCCIHYIPHGGKICGISGTPACYARSGSDINVITLGTAAGFLELFIKRVFFPVYIYIDPH